MLFSNVGSGPNFVASILMFILICSNFFSRDVTVLERGSSCAMIYDEILTDVSCRTSVVSDRKIVSVLSRTSSFSIYFDS